MSRGLALDLWKTCGGGIAHFSQRTREMGHPAKMMKGENMANLDWSKCPAVGERSRQAQWRVGV
jgi:hypothetical protein